MFHTAVFGAHVVCACVRVRSLPGGLLPSQHRKWSIVFRVLFQQTNKQTNKVLVCLYACMHGLHPHSGDRCSYLSEVVNRERLCGTRALRWVASATWAAVRPLEEVCLFLSFVCWNKTRKTILHLLCWEGSKPPGSDHTRTQAQTTCV